MNPVKDDPESVTVTDPHWNGMIKVRDQRGEVISYQREHLEHPGDVQDGFSARILFLDSTSEVIQSGRSSKKGFPKLAVKGKVQSGETVTWDLKAPNDEAYEDWLQQINNIIANWTEFHFQLQATELGSNFLFSGSDRLGRDKQLGCLRINYQSDVLDAGLSLEGYRQLTISGKEGDGGATTTWLLQARDETEHSEWISRLRAGCRARWDPNNSKNCGICGKQFNLSDSVHHCRRCGKCVCHDCSPYAVPLETLGIETPVRVCTSCETEVNLKIARADVQEVVAQVRDATGYAASQASFTVKEVEDEAGDKHVTTTVRLHLPRGLGE